MRFEIKSSIFSLVKIPWEIREKTWWKKDSLFSWNRKFLEFWRSFTFKEQFSYREKQIIHYDIKINLRFPSFAHPPLKSQTNVQNLASSPPLVITLTTWILNSSSPSTFPPPKKKKRNRNEANRIRGRKRVKEREKRRSIEQRVNFSLVRTRREPREGEGGGGCRCPSMGGGSRIESGRSHFHRKVSSFFMRGAACPEVFRPRGKLLLRSLSRVR